MHEARCEDKLNSEIIMIFSISSRHKETSHSVQLKRNYTFVSALGGQLFLTRTLSSWTTWMKCSSTMTTTDVMYLRVYCISTPPHHVRSDSPLWGWYTVLFGQEGHSNQSSSYLLLFLCRHVRNCVMMARTTFTYWLPPPLLFHFLSALLYSSCAFNGQHLICGPPIKLLLKPFRNSPFPRNFFKSINSP